MAGNRPKPRLEKSLENTYFSLLNSNLTVHLHFSGKTAVSWPATCDYFRQARQSRLTAGGKAMLVYLDNYRKTRIAGAVDSINAAGLKNGTYGDDTMKASRTSAVLSAIHLPPQQSLSPDLPDDLSAVDVDALMNRIYALASQV
jgi:hypothetical protein